MRSMMMAAIAGALAAAVCFSSSTALAQTQQAQNPKQLQCPSSCEQAHRYCLANSQKTFNGFNCDGELKSCKSPVTLGQWNGPQVKCTGLKIETPN